MISSPDSPELTDSLLLQYAEGKFQEDVKWRGKELATELLCMRNNYKALRKAYAIQNGYSR